MHPAIVFSYWLGFIPLLIADYLYFPITKAMYFKIGFIWLIVFIILVSIFEEKETGG